MERRVMIRSCLLGCVFSILAYISLLVLCAFFVEKGAIGVEMIGLIGYLVMILSCAAGSYPVVLNLGRPAMWFIPLTTPLLIPMIVITASNTFSLSGVTKTYVSIFLGGIIGICFGFRRHNKLRKSKKSLRRSY